MATVWKHPNSPYWTAIYRDEAGVWRKKTTKQNNRSKAMTLSLEWERAGELGRNKLITEAVSREIIGGILHRTTGDALRAETVREFTARWLAAKALNKHEGTATRYGGTVDKVLEFLGPRADRPIAAVTPADCQRFNDHLLERRLAPSTLVVEIKTLRTIFNAALRQGLVAANPAAGVELPQRIKQVKRMRFTTAQVEMLLNAADNPEWRVCILLGYYAGLRLSDAVSLAWEHVDLMKGVLVFDVRKTDDEGHTVPLHPVLKAHLMRLAGDKGGPISPGLAGVTVGGRSGLSKQFLAIMRKAGIGNESVDTSGHRKLSQLSFHSLRVSFNSELANRGVTQETRKKLTGHKSDAVNDRYTRTEVKTLRTAVNKMPSVKQKSRNTT